MKNNSSKNSSPLPKKQFSTGKKHLPDRHTYFPKSVLCIALSPHNSVSVLYLDSIFQNTNLIAVNCLVRHLTSYAMG